MLTLSPLEVGLIQDYLEEIDAVIEADDGTLTPMPLIDKHHSVKELFYGDESE